MRATLIFTWTQIKRSFRDPMAMFFTIIFPLIFLFIFGTIFGNNDISFNVALVNQSDSQFAQEFSDNLSKNDVFKVKNDLTFEAARGQMSRGELDSIIELPADFGNINADFLPAGAVNVYYDEANPEGGQTVASLVGSVFDEINVQMTGQTPPLTVMQKSTAVSGLTQFDYTFAGLLAFTLMTMGIFGLSNQLPGEKKTGALRRIKATPFRSHQLVIGMVLAYTVLTILSVAVMIAVGLLVFHFDMRGSWLTLAVFAIFTALVLSGFGAAIASWARNENQSATLSQAVAFPMMFLSGIFFPRFLMPDWLQNATAWIPLTPVGDGVRYIITENASLITLLPQIGLLAAWGLVVYFIAAKAFRWE
ncbi:MAG: ABC transporter permease [Candidatus Nomurabacteria bacterium]|jgi:ABC-2 type transport system permease protein|nr:ABC transporter permease [Candidatus Nomurabacteria bacterium]